MKRKLKTKISFFLFCKILIFFHDVLFKVCDLISLGTQESYLPTQFRDRSFLITRKLVLLDGDELDINLYACLLSLLVRSLSKPCYSRQHVSKSRYSLQRLCVSSVHSWSVRSELNYDYTFGFVSYFCYCLTCNLHF